MEGKEKTKTSMKFWRVGIGKLFGLLSGAGSRSRAANWRIGGGTDSTSLGNSTDDDLHVLSAIALAGLEKLPGANQIHCGLATLTGSGRTWFKLLFDNPIMEASSSSTCTLERTSRQ